jgi:hypothetical protein
VRPGQARGPARLAAQPGSRPSRGFPPSLLLWSARWPSQAPPRGPAGLGGPAFPPRPHVHRARGGWNRRRLPPRWAPPVNRPSPQNLSLSPHAPSCTSPPSGSPVAGPPPAALPLAAVSPPLLLLAPPFFPSSVRRRSARRGHGMARPRRARSPCLGARSRPPPCAARGGAAWHACPCSERPACARPPRRALLLPLPLPGAAAACLWRAASRRCPAARRVRGSSAVRQCGLAREGARVVCAVL